MSKIDRRFEIIQLLRSARHPLVASEIAQCLEVSIRTVYRDIAALQAMRIPVEGERGVGYIMRKGYDLPPLSFDTNETEAISLGLQMIARLGDSELWQAAKSATRKLGVAAPPCEYLVSSCWGISETPDADVSLIRSAIRDKLKLHLHYTDSKGQSSERTVWPFALIYFVDRAVLAAKCELRNDTRHFRLDRITRCQCLHDACEEPKAVPLAHQDRVLLRDWTANQKAELVSTLSI